MHECPCCSSPLLRHVHYHEICWFCPHCWTTMPVLSELILSPRGKVLGQLFNQCHDINGNAHADDRW